MERTWARTRGAAIHGPRAMYLNDNANGVFEILSWVETKMTDLENVNKWGSMRQEVGDAIHHIRGGVEVDFRERLRAPV
jgi:hypothetical protein